MLKKNNLKWPEFCVVFKLRKNYKITQIINGCSTVIFKCSLLKEIMSLVDIAEYICQIKIKSDGNFFLERANEHFLVSGRSN